jgi:hypothetical protein
VWVTIIPLPLKEFIPLKLLFKDLDIWGCWMRVPGGLVIFVKAYKKKEFNS